MSHLEMREVFPVQRGEVSIAQSGDVFKKISSNGRFLAKKLNELLGDPKGYPTGEQTIDGVTFYHRKSGTNDVWTFKETDLNKVAMILDSRVVFPVQLGEVSITRMNEVFQTISSNARFLAKKLNEQLGDPKAHPPGEQTIDGVTFYHRKSRTKDVWTFKETDLDKVKEIAIKLLSIQKTNHNATSMRTVIEAEVIIKRYDFPPNDFVVGLSNPILAALSIDPKEFAKQLTDELESLGSNSDASKTYQGVTFYHRHSNDEDFWVFKKEDFVKVCENILMQMFPDLAPRIEVYIQSCGQNNKTSDEILQALAKAKNSPTKPEIKLIRNMHTTLERERKKLRSADANTLQAALGKASVEKNQAKLLAALIEIMQRSFGFPPNNTQIIAIVALIEISKQNPRGCIAEMMTGEGKTLVFAILGAFQALLDPADKRPVATVTVSHELAKRDANLFAPFYAMCKLTTHIIDRDRDANLKTIPKADIHFGTNNDYELTTLGRSVRGLEVIIPKVALVDEVDSLLSDQADIASIICIPHPQGKWYARAIEKIASYAATITQKPTLEQFINGFNSIEISNEILIEKLPELLESAYSAFYLLEEHIHYVADFRLRFPTIKGLR